MLGALFAIALSSGSQVPAASHGVVLAQASAGPSKAGMYVIEVKCPVESNHLIVMQANSDGLKRKTGANIVRKRAINIVIESSLNSSKFEIVFPRGSKFNKYQLNKIEDLMRDFLSEIYLDVCLNQRGQREKFMAQVKANRARLTASAVK